MIRQRLSWLAVAAVLVAGAVPLRASSLPVINGNANGIELCDQAMCGSAIFVAIYNGQIGGNGHALGTIAVSVTHSPLPGPDDPPAALIGGVWQLQPLLGRKISGMVTGGSLANNNGDGTFHVIANMLITSGGVGTLTFDGTLSHNTFPPTIDGHIGQ
jgi:hypothetical protein